jgi:membrane protein required for colicin V production
MALVQDIGWVDALLLGVLVISMVVGVIRGLVFEVLSLLGWLVAYVAAQWLAPDAAPHIPLGTAGSALNMAAALALCFVAALVVWGLLARLVRLLIRATPLSLIDRLLGAGFGALRGVLLLLVLCTVVSMTPARNSPAWQASRGVVWLSGALRGIEPLLPSEISRHLPT